MCGKETELLKALVEGAELNVCENCASFGRVIGKIKEESVEIEDISFETKKQTEEIIEIIVSTSLKFLSLFNLPEGQLANIRKFFFELSNLFLSQISSVMKGINGCNKISICLKT